MVAFYVEQGATVDSTNAHRETPLACAVYWACNIREQTYSTAHHLICRMLLDYKAEVDSRDEDFRTPLHKAAWNCDCVLIDMLLEAGAEPNLMDDNGCGPLQYVLKVLQSCYSYPKVIEVIVNSYEHIKSTSKWRPAVPDDVFELYRDFYESLFEVCGNTPRSLKHLARCAIRRTMFNKCHKGIPSLLIPRSCKSKYQSPFPNLEIQWYCTMVS
ncbi:UNVERIFIED_CONTAM: hypothetical protein K2H54_033618 [Gekko kuhli]